ncbi:MAG: sulfate ABC transporter substrate-binding protein [Planctomycetota bacterium]
MKLEEASTVRQDVTLLNASYDPTRELWNEINKAFVDAYESTHNVKLTIKQSHGSSGSQARAIIDGLEADVATLSIWPDTDSLRKRGLLAEGWENAFPNRSLPYTSTVVFVTRKGNPKQIKDWPDLIQGEVQIVTPSPRTSGNGKLSFLAAWGSVIASGGTEADALAFVRKLYRRVPVLDAGARGATTTFAQKGVGDVHLTLENEALLEVRKSRGALEIIYPSISIIHEPHIAVVDSVVDTRRTREVATEYLRFLYTPTGQEMIANHFFRPSDSKVLKKHGHVFKAIKLFPIESYAQSWAEANDRFFAEGGVFDQIYEDSSPP